MVPDFPWCVAVALVIDVFQLLAILERIHRHPEPIVFVSGQLPGPDQPLEWLTDQLFTAAHVCEDLGAKHKKPTVDPDRRLPNLVNGGDAAAVSDRHQMIAQVWLDADEA